MIGQKLDFRHPSGYTSEQLGVFIAHLKKSFEKPARERADNEFRWLTEGTGEPELDPLGTDPGPQFVPKTNKRASRKKKDNASSVAGPSDQRRTSVSKSKSTRKKSTKKKSDTSDESESSDASVPRSSSLKSSSNSRSLKKAKKRTRAEEEEAESTGGSSSEQDEPPIASDGENNDAFLDEEERNALAAVRRRKKGLTPAKSNTTEGHSLDEMNPDFETPEDAPEPNSEASSAFAEYALQDSRMTAKAPYNPKEVSLD